MESASSAASVAREYFARVTAADPSVAELFADDAELIGLGDRVVGRDAIGEFYSRTLREAGPKPEVRCLVNEGEVTFAEIVIVVPGLDPIHVVDRFETRDGRIRSLTYFVADDADAG
jgi:hypothetical protein